MTKLYAMVLYNTDLPVTHDLFKEVLFDSSYDYDVRTIALWALEDEYIENPEEVCYLLNFRLFTNQCHLDAMGIDRLCLQQDHRLPLPDGSLGDDLAA